ncbi:MAG: methionyl-tRNA formyltransferase [Desulfosalsimonadaceae bacterium]
MEKNNFTAIFMGTPDFAVPSLKALAASVTSVPVVLTQPDRPKGRGKKLMPPPVKVAAEELGCEIWQPESIGTEAICQAIAAKKPDILVVVAFGRILPEKILEIPPYGAINVHASLLPKYRGPAPIHWAIINGETETGITTMLMDAGLDTGEILLTEKTQIAPHDTAGTLHDRLAGMGGDVLRRTIKAMQEGKLRPVPQNHAEASHAPLLKKSDGRIDWCRPAAVIERKVRGMNPWPLAHTFYRDKRLNIFKAEIRPAEPGVPPGTVMAGFSGELRVATGEEALSILELQGASGKRLPIRDFLSGTPVAEGERLQ